MKILFLQKRILFPADVGMKIRTLNVLRHLARWHDVTYLCNAQRTDEPFLDEMLKLGVTLETVPWTEAPRGSLRFYRDLARNLFSPFPFNVDKDFDPALRARAANLLQNQKFDLLVCDFVQMARNAFGLKVPASVLFQHNVESEVLRRQANGSFAKRAFLGYQASKMRRFEAQAGRRFDTVIAISERDRSIFEQDYGWSHVRVIDTAVDTAYFRPSDRQPTPGRCVFIGSLDWPPNREGVLWFVERIWPKVKASCPGATFQVVGRNPPADIQRLGNVNGVEVVGTVPDVRPHLAEAELSVVPLLSGGGTRLKIFESMASGVPVISTRLGAEGLPVSHEKELLIADDPDSFAAAVVGVIQDQQKRTGLVNSALEAVTTRFGDETVARQFEAICQEAIESKRIFPASAG